MKPREWWIGKTQDGFDKWLTGKHPDEHECRNAFITSDGQDGCAEYIHVREVLPDTVTINVSEFMDQLSLLSFVRDGADLVNLDDIEKLIASTVASPGGES